MFYYRAVLFLFYVITTSRKNNRDSSLAFIVFKLRLQFLPNKSEAAGHIRDGNCKVGRYRSGRHSLTGRSSQSGHKTDHKSLEVKLSFLESKFSFLRLKFSFF